MGVFRFKQFEVLNEASSMKVNTDGVILGAAATIKDDDGHVLDIGTGTGTIALMLAQRYPSPKPSLTGIDIDAPSASEAAVNFSRSPWGESLQALHVSLQDYYPPQPFDLIVSNPPFFKDSLLPPERRRGISRHSESLPFGDIGAFASQNLSERGRLSLVMPSGMESMCVRTAASYGLYPFHFLRIKSIPSKPFSRVIMEFSRSRVEEVYEESMVLSDPCNPSGTKKGRTPEYEALTKDFYL